MLKKTTFVHIINGHTKSGTQEYILEHPAFEIGKHSIHVTNPGKKYEQGENPMDKAGNRIVINHPVCLQPDDFFGFGNKKTVVGKLMRLK